MKDEGILIPWDYIQGLVEDNYGKKLTKKQMKEFVWFAWEADSVWELDSWLLEAADEFLKQT